MFDCYIFCALIIWLIYFPGHKLIKKNKNFEVDPRSQYADFVLKKKMECSPKVVLNNIPPEDRFELKVRSKKKSSVFNQNYRNVVYNMRRRCWLNNKTVGDIWCLSESKYYQSAFLILSISFDDSIKCDFLIYKPSIYFVGYFDGLIWRICEDFETNTGHVFGDSVSYAQNAFDVRYSNIPKVVSIDVLRGAVRRLQNPQNSNGEDIKESIDTIIVMFCETVRLEGFLTQICEKLRFALPFDVSVPLTKLFNNYNTLCIAYTLSCEKGMLWEYIDGALEVEARTGCNNAEKCKAMLGMLKPVDIDACRKRVSKYRARIDPPGSDPGSGSRSGSRSGFGASGSGRGGNSKGRKQDKWKEQGKGKGKKPVGGGGRRAVVPALGLPFSVQHSWKTIKEKKDLDLPAHKAFLFSCYSYSLVWLQREEASQFSPITGFGKELSILIGVCLYQYNSEAGYFDEGVRTFKRKHLEENVFQLVVFDKGRTIQGKLYMTGSKVDPASPNLVQRLRKLFKDAVPCLLKDAGHWIFSHSLVFKGFNVAIDEAVKFSEYDPVGGLLEPPLKPSGIRCAEVFLFVAGDFEVKEDGLCSQEAVKGLLHELNSKEGISNLLGFDCVAASVMVPKKKLEELKDTHLSMNA